MKREGKRWGWDKVQIWIDMKKEKKKMEFAQSKDLDCFKKGKKPWGFGLG